MSLSVWHRYDWPNRSSVLVVEQAEILLAEKQLLREEISPSDVPWGVVENDTFLSGNRLSHERASESLNRGLGSGRDLIGPV